MPHFDRIWDGGAEMVAVAVGKRFCFLIRMHDYCGEKIVKTMSADSASIGFSQVDRITEGFLQLSYVEVDASGGVLSRARYLHLRYMK
jgi:hypothetical protein